MAQVSNESVAVMIPTVTVAAPDDSIPEQQPQKLKGRKRLLQGFQRISSSPSLARMGRTQSSGYRTASKASVSCISLSSPYGEPLTPSLSTELSNGFSTAPSTPGIQIPPLDERARVKYLTFLESQRSVPVPVEVRPASRLGATPGIKEEADYFSIPLQHPRRKAQDINFWADLPYEIRTEILSYLEPEEVVRCSAVSKNWHKHCFDGQLWSILDTTKFYQSISANSLVSIISAAGPFLRDLNLRGCVQLREKCHTQSLVDACRNLENMSLEDCRIDRTSIHGFLLHNTRLVRINFSGLSGATNHAMKIISQHCPKIECLNVSWCNNVDARGLRRVVEGCPKLRDLRAGEIRGWDDLDIMHELFKRNTLERLVLMNCESLNDASLGVLMEGRDSEMDYLTGRPIVPPRVLKHLDITKCRGVSDEGIRTCINNLPFLEGLQLAKCTALTDSAVASLLPTMPLLTHLDLEELEELTNATLQTLANSPCAKTFRHLSISYCENLGDTGMLPVLRNCHNLASLEMDNTRISDLVLTEAASMVRQRSSRTFEPMSKPTVGLKLVAYDCQNVTWTGVREILSRNAEITTSRRIVPASELRTLQQSSASGSSTPTAISTSSVNEVIQLTRNYPTQVIQLRCFYNYQPTVEEHTKRVLRGDFHAANRLERKWAEFMMAQEEAGAGGAGSRRRRRRAREAQMMHADEEDAAASGGTGVGGGRRRRARSGGCVMM